MSSQPGSEIRGQLPLGTFPVIGEVPAGHAAMHQRIVELEGLCAEVYQAAVLMGLPQPLLAKLWMVASHGNSPRGHAIDLPEGAEPPIDDMAFAHLPSAAAIAPPDLPELPVRKIVMVVDDDPAMLDLILKILETENYELYSSDRGDSALDAFHQMTVVPDLLITDLMMPGFSGSQLAAAMRRRAPALRVLYQTGFTDMLFKAKQELEQGASFVEKPFSARSLIEAARLALFGTMYPAASAPPPPAEPPKALWSFFD
jgi:CheY-like chemotaxis protein